MKQALFSDRRDAGSKLAALLQSRSAQKPIVVAMATGGVPVGQMIASELRAPMETLVVRKICARGDSGRAIGAMAEDGLPFLNEGAMNELNLKPDDLAGLIDGERAELGRRIQAVRGGKPLSNVIGRVVILVDDLISTGLTAFAATRYLRELGAHQIIIAAPMASTEAAHRLRYVAEEVITLAVSETPNSIKNIYEHFDSLSNEEALEVLARHNQAATRRLVAFRERECMVTDGRINLPASLSVPQELIGAVIFAHGSGSSRMSPRNTEVARQLNRAGFATLLFDLLASGESIDRENVFDIPLLARRLLMATHWLREKSGFTDTRIGYFGASTGAAAALRAAAEIGTGVSAVVSRGGRPDLAMPSLAAVEAPTLLLVGGEDHEVLKLNQQALKLIPRGELVVVPGATHLFEEPGTLDQVSDNAIAWFERHLVVGGGKNRGEAA